MRRNKCVIEPVGITTSRFDLFPLSHILGHQRLPLYWIRR
jgi:hypothetical protein